jgi:hypothetical protein
MSQLTFGHKDGTDDQDGTQNGQFLPQKEAGNNDDVVNGK